jgi:hypothetical protein
MPPGLPGIGQYITPKHTVVGSLEGGTPITLHTQEIYKIIHYFKHKDNFKIFIIAIDDKMRLTVNRFGYNTEEYNTICTYYNDFKVLDYKLTNILVSIYG